MTDHHPEVYLFEMPKFDEDLKPWPNYYNLKTFEMAVMNLNFDVDHSKVNSLLLV